MQSKAKTVEQYLKELPPDRRAAISAVRDVILKNLDGEYEEGMLYGMIGYFVPHRTYPAGYQCDPTKRQGNRKRSAVAALQKKAASKKSASAGATKKKGSQLRVCPDTPKP